MMPNARLFNGVVITWAMWTSLTKHQREIIIQSIKVSRSVLEASDDDV